MYSLLVIRSLRDKGESRLSSDLKTLVVSDSLVTLSLESRLEDLPTVAEEWELSSRELSLLLQLLFFGRGFLFCAFSEVLALLLVGFGCLSVTGQA